jgi:hypothetical protein
MQQKAAQVIPSKGLTIDLCLRDCSSSSVGSLSRKLSPVPARRIPQFVTAHEQCRHDQKEQKNDACE